MLILEKEEVVGIDQEKRVFYKTYTFILINYKQTKKKLNSLRYLKMQEWISLNMTSNFYLISLWGLVLKIKVICWNYNTKQ